MKLSVLVLSAALIAGCASTPSSETKYVVSHKPPDYVVIYISDSGSSHPNPAYLDVDSTKKQALYFIAEGNDLHVTFKDGDHPFKVDCSGRLCTARIDKQHKNLFEYRYGVRFINTRGVSVEIDPIVIIDEIQALMH